MLWYKPILVTLFFTLFPLVAGANHPRPDQMERVKSIAHELQEATGAAYQTALQYSSRGGWREQYALEHLGHLELAARHFHQQVESFFQDPEHTEHDYLNLEIAYHDAESTLFDLRANHIWVFNNQWQRVRGLMQELSFFYSGGGIIPDPHLPAPVQVVITQIDQGGSLTEATVRLSGYLQGAGITNAGIYVDGGVKRMIQVIPHATRHDFHARLKWSRFSTQHRVEIRVRLYNGLEQTVWAQVF